MLATKKQNSVKIKTNHTTEPTEKDPKRVTRRVGTYFVPTRYKTSTSRGYEPGRMGTYFVLKEPTFGAHA